MAWQAEHGLFQAETRSSTSATRAGHVPLTELRECGDSVFVRDSASRFREHHTYASLLADFEPFRPGVELLGPKCLQHSLDSHRRLESRSRPSYRITREASHDDPLERWRKIDDVVERLRILDELRIDLRLVDRGLVAFGKWAHSGERLVECGAEPEQIALRTDFSVHELLGRHVRRRSHRVSQLDRAGERLRQREVEEPWRVSHGDVVGLHVEMKDMIGVHV